MTLILFLVVFYYVVGNYVFPSPENETNSLLLLLAYGITYFFASIFLLLGLKEARIRDHFNIDAHLQQKTEPSHCQFCNQVWNPADMVYWAWGTSKGVIRLGPLCPNCWDALRVEFPEKLGPSWTSLGILVIFTFIVVFALSIFVTPDAGAIGYAVVGTCLAFVGGMLVMGRRAPSDRDNRNYHPALGATPLGSASASINTPKMCTYHHHVQAIASCPFCGEHFCNLCMLFPNLKFALPRQEAMRIYRQAQVAQQRAAGNPFAPAIFSILTLQTAATQLPESNLNDPLERANFENLLLRIPDRFREFYTPAAHATVMRILNGEDSAALNQNIFVLSCLMHNARRGLRATAKEKANRGISFILLITLLPLLVIVPLGALVPATIVPFLMNGLLILLFLTLRNPHPMGAKPIAANEEANDELIDQFLLYLDELIYQIQLEQK
ncbi:MAG TPA: hypothetical protein VKK79_20415 [Candidatus Lokiarchaeia archaeon]|nr:hypothetical protein [Candidatus Lokiarchaeia archaeon]